MISKVLKESTREQHERLENIVNVLDESTDIDSYRELLIRFYRIYAALEPAIPEQLLLENGFNYSTRRKLPAIAKDLVYLGIADQLERLPRFERTPAMPNAAKAFGAVYVIEGSTLGGQVISRHLREHLRLTPQNGASFFSSYGVEVGPKWKEFCDILNRFGQENPEMADEVIRGANETFAAFAECLGEPMKINSTT